MRLCIYIIIYMDDIKYNHKLFYITSGILLILLSVICFLNMGIVARGVGIIFYYPFGFGAYFIFAFLIVQGFSLIISEVNGIDQTSFLD